MRMCSKILKISVESEPLLQYSFPYKTVHTKQSIINVFFANNLNIFKIFCLVMNILYYIGNEYIILY